MSTKTPWSLRDNPVSLVIATLGLLAFILTMGWLTVRAGTLWTHRYLNHQTKSPSSGDADAD